MQQLLADGQVAGVDGREQGDVAILRGEENIVYILLKKRSDCDNIIRGLEMRNLSLPLSFPFH